MIDILSTILAWLKQGHCLALATIVSHEGSTPRGAGSKMIVRADGVTFGTVGGGLVEARVLKAAASVFQGGSARMEEFDLSGELAAGADLICGGRLRVFLERIEPEPGKVFFADLLDRLERGERCVTAVSRDGEDRFLLSADGRISGTGTAHEVILAGLRRAGKQLRIPAIWCAQDRQWILEPWSGPWPLYVAGSGHVARTTVQMAAMVGFRVTVLDDRPEFANLEHFPQAHRIYVVDMNSCLEYVDVNAQASIVILTRGHVHDAEVLAQAVQTDAGFIGMIGSRRKRDSLYSHLLDHGFSNADLARVHCPIGLDIQAETPEEIAVSIVAQLIQFRAWAEKELACADRPWRRALRPIGGPDPVLMERADRTHLADGKICGDLHHRQPT